MNDRTRSGNGSLVRRGIPVPGREESIAAALEETRKGYAVVASIPGTSKPREQWRYGPNGPIGLRTEAELRAQWPKGPSAVCIITGLCGLIVPDFDWKDEWSESHPHPWDRLQEVVEASGHSMPDTREIKTRRGFHQQYLANGVPVGTCSGKIIGLDGTPIEGLDIKSGPNLERVWDPTEPERQVSRDVVPARMPTWLAKILNNRSTASSGSIAKASSIDEAKKRLRAVPDGERHDAVGDFVTFLSRHGDDEMVLAIAVPFRRFLHDKDGWAYEKGSPEADIRQWLYGDKEGRPVFSSVEEREILASLSPGESEVLASAFSRQQKENVLALRRERARLYARETIESERAGSASLFSVVDWSDVTDNAEIELGPEGVFLRSGRMWVSGIAGAGKSALGYWTLLCRIRALECPMAVYEAEMGRVRVKRLLRSLGATPAEMNMIRYYYASADRGLVADGKALCAQVASDGCEGLLYDAAAGLLARAGLDENKTSDVLRWVSAAVDPFAESGGFVYVIDHTGWGADDRPRGASGKPAAGDAVFVLSSVSAFRRGVSGRISLSCTKDRDGLLSGMTQDIEVDCSNNGIWMKPCGWDSIDDVATVVPVRKGSSTQMKIMDFLQENGVSSVESVAAGLGIEAEAARSALRRGSRGKSVVFSLVDGGLWKLARLCRSGSVG